MRPVRSVYVVRYLGRRLYCTAIQRAWRLPVIEINELTIPISAAESERPCFECTIAINYAVTILLCLRDNRLESSEDSL